MTQVAVFYAIKWICGVSAFGCGYMCMGVCVCVHTEIHKKSRSSERWHTRRASSHQSEKQVFSNQPSFLAYFLCRLTAQTSFTCRPPALSPDPILLKVTPSDNLQVLFSVFATFGLFFPNHFFFILHRVSRSHIQVHMQLLLLYWKPLSAPQNGCFSVGSVQAIMDMTLSTLWSHTDLLL